MLKNFKKHITSHFPELSEKHFLLACSGGIDSVVLVHLCKACGLTFSVAHCNFNLRAEESDADEIFVRDLAASIQNIFFVTNFNTNTYVSQHKVSVQMAARELRYAWFAKIMEENNIDILVTAHHADDALETFIINLSRGTGIAGLKGIPAKKDGLYRPLLPFSSEEILSYATAEKIVWREDKSNANTKYLRNKIRHDIIPKLKELHPTFLNNFKNTLGHLSDSSAITANHINQLKSKLFLKENGVIKIAIAELEKLQPNEAYIYHIFNAYGFTAFKDIIILYAGLSGKEVLSPTHRLVKHRAYLLLEKRRPKFAEAFEIAVDAIEIEGPIQLKINLVSKISNTGNHILYVDDKALKYPLIVRKWEKGDYFYPFGMKGKKKLAKFFKDEQMDVISKENQWLLCSNNTIVWVIGKRADDRFKITSKTKQIKKFTIQI